MTYSALDITVKSIIMLNRIADIEVSDSKGLIYVDGEQPDFLPIDDDLFVKGSFSDLAYDYLDDNWGNGYDEDGDFAKWLNDNADMGWFDILKDEDGDYYCVAGDRTGVVFYVEVYSIRIIYDDYDIRINEDEKYIYIMGGIVDRCGDYDKQNWTLENAIKDYVKNEIGK